MLLSCFPMQRQVSVHARVVPHPRRRNDRHPLAKPASVAVSFSSAGKEKMILIGGEAGQTDWRDPHQAGVIFGI
jgi:hypothetical protein